MNARDVGLARRAIACKDWRWMPGMLALPSFGDVEWRRVAGGGFYSAVKATEVDGVMFVDGPWPDFQDPATLGCLLALVREAWKMPDIAATAWRGDTLEWEFAWAGYGRLGPCGRWPTEAEALVAALEAAP